VRIAIVNDLRLAVETLRRLVLSLPGCEVAWVAADGREAVTRCRADRPDLILMDLLMPNLDGVQATREIMRESPCPILIVTSSVSGNAAKVFEALGSGAVDAVSTPVGGAAGPLEGGDEVARKILMVARLTGHDGVVVPAAASRGARGGRPFLVAVGSSTGGPRALVQVLADLPRTLPAAVVIVQHVDVQFAGSLAEWIAGETGWEAGLACSGQEPRPGRVFVAGTNDHLVLGPDRSFHYQEEPVDQPYRPSVDTFFASVERHWPDLGVAVLLTGMGRDGAQGLLGLRRARWHTIAQDEATSVIYGMPKAAADLGAAVEILPVDAIGAAIARHVGRGGA